MSAEVDPANGGNAVVDTKGNILSTFAPTVGNAAINLDAKNANGDRATYARVRSQVSSSAAGAEKGFLVGEAGNSGSFNKGWVVNEDGDLISTTATAAAPDSTLHNGSVSFYLTEGSNELRVKVKESGGNVLDGLVSNYA
jgi:hypothetical protein